MCISHLFTFYFSAVKCTLAIANSHSHGTTVANFIGSDLPLFIQLIRTLFTFLDKPFDCVNAIFCSPSLPLAIFVGQLGVSFELHQYTMHPLCTTWLYIWTFFPNAFRWFQLNCVSYVSDHDLFSQFARTHTHMQRMQRLSTTVSIDSLLEFESHMKGFVWETIWHLCMF